VGPASGGRRGSGESASDARRDRGGEPTRARLFVALELPPNARGELAGWARSAVGEHPGLRLVAEESLHVTLCFLGSVDTAVVGSIVSRCESAVAGLGGAGPAPLRSIGALWLPHRRPRVLAVELRDELGLAGRCQAALARELAEGGWYTPEGRPFLPHVTVARVRHGRGFDVPSPPSSSFSGERVSLMRSRLGSGGARYERIAAVPLTPSRR
jgi:2'-5' RNA ligase